MMQVLKQRELEQRLLSKKQEEEDKWKATAEKKAEQQKKYDADRRKMIADRKKFLK